MSLASNYLWLLPPVILCCLPVILFRQNSKSLIFIWYVLSNYSMELKPKLSPNGSLTTSNTQSTAFFFFQKSQFLSCARSLKWFFREQRWSGAAFLRTLLLRVKIWSGTSWPHDGLVAVPLWSMLLTLLGVDSVWLCLNNWLDLSGTHLEGTQAVQSPGLSSFTEKLQQKESMYSKIELR